MFKLLSSSDSLTYKTVKLVFNLYYVYIELIVFRTKIKRQNCLLAYMSIYTFNI